MTTTIYHNPKCTTSRNVLATLRAGGETPEVIEYLRDPPSRETVRRLAADAGLSIREVLRQSGTPYDELGLDDPTLSDDALLDAIEAHPILLNRPFVVTGRGTVLARPAEKVLAVMANPPAEVVRG